MPESDMNRSESPSFGHAQIVDVQCGKEVRIINPSNLYGCSIGDHSFIGPFVEIQSKASIGKNSRIQSHCFVCSLVEIGDSCFVGHGVTFVNDLFKDGNPSKDERDWLPTKIGNEVSIGSGSTILPVKICDGCVVGAGSVVVRDLTIRGVYAGNPAKLIREI